MLHGKIHKVLNGQGDSCFPFFWQRSEEEAVFRDYLRVIRESDIGAVCIESRPYPDFCVDAWWRDMDIILDEACKRNILN